MACDYWLLVLGFRLFFLGDDETIDCLSRNEMISLVSEGIQHVYFSPLSILEAGWRLNESTVGG